MTVRSRLLTGLVLVLFLVGAPASALEVWVEPATARVFPDDPRGFSRTARVAAARNETEAFQVVVHGGAAGLSGVDAVLSDLVGPGGRRIPAAQGTLYREHYVDVTKASFVGGVVGNRRRTGEYPDPLVPFEDPYDPAHPRVGAPFDVAAGRNQPVWIDLKVPEGTLAGRYRGTLTVTANGTAAVEVEVVLTVWDFTIPREPSMATAYGLSWSKILWYHGGADGQWDADALEVLGNYERAMHEHRLDQTNPHQIVSSPFVFDEAGELLPVDWSEYDAFVGPRLDGSHFGDGVGQRRFNVGFFRPGRDAGLQVSLTDAQYQAAAAAFAEHLVERGWMERAYVYVQDEPFLRPEAYPRIVADVALMKAAHPAWDGRFMVTNWPVPVLDGSIDIWCPDTSKYDDWFLGFLGLDFAGRAEYPERFALGEELWFYVCNCTAPPYAGYDIDTKLGFEPRVLMWAAWAERATGFLYWRTNYWQRDDPWRKVIAPEAFPLVARSGDGFLFYPGDHDGTAAPAGSPDGIAMNGPVPTIRLKATRDGLEDWEMLLLASERVGEDAVRAVVAAAYDRPGGFPIRPVYDPEDPPWTYDEAVLRATREAVAELIAPTPGGCGTVVGEHAARGWAALAWLVFALVPAIARRARSGRRQNLAL